MPEGCPLMGWSNNAISVMPGGQGLRFTTSLQGCVCERDNRDTERQTLETEQLKGTLGWYSHQKQAGSI